MNREDFPIFSDGLVYLDNGATTMKPKCVVDEINKYYLEYTANAHRGDYHNSVVVDTKYERVREKVKNFINAESEKEIVFTLGTTDSINMITQGFMKYYLKENDEVLITESEHASNFLPWVELSKEIGIKVKYIELVNNKVTIERVKEAITSNTKVISIAGVTNVLGDVRPINEIGALCKEKGILFVVDGAQSVPHIKTDVIKDNIDFLAFSSHKMLGPTGVGVLYGKYELLKELHPVRVGGGMNSYFEKDLSYEYHDLPSKLEAGTQNIAGVIGFGAAIDYLSNIGMDKIREHELVLKKYFIERSKELDNIEIYNDDLLSGTVSFNIKDIFSQDLAVYLDKYHIAVRAGNHCAKVLKEVIGVKNTCRISFYLYNTKEDVDKVIEALKNPNIKREII